MRTVLRAATLALAGSALALLAAGCGGREPSSRAPMALGAPDNAFLVEERELADFKPVSAVLTNRDISAARARIAGTLTKLAAREGDIVEKGQVVAVVSDRRRELETGAATADAAAAEARAKRAAADFARVKELFDNGVYAQARLDAAEADVRGADAELRAARARRESAKEAEGQGDVLAPAAGRITRAPVPQGVVVMAGDIIAELATGQRVLRIELPEAEAHNIREGTEARLADAEGGKVARVLQVYPGIENGKVVVDIDAAGFDDAFVGVRTPVFVPVGLRRAIVIPSKLIATRYGVDYVRLLSSDGATIDAPVQRGARLPTDDGEHLVEVLSGLRAGDRLVPVAEPNQATMTALAAGRS